MTGRSSDHVAMYVDNSARAGLTLALLKLQTPARPLSETLAAMEPSPPPPQVVTSAVIAVGSIAQSSVTPSAAAEAYGEN